MESEARAAVRFLETVDERDRPHVRLASFYCLSPEERPEFEKLSKPWWRQLTLNSNRRNFLNRVPGSDTLWWFDLRSFNWNDAAWRAVALRDKTFREPGVTHQTASRLRKLIGEEQPENFHVVAVVDVFGLYRRTYQTLETTDYYDLLFAEQRFPLTGETEYRPFLKYWRGGVDENGDDCRPGWYEYRKLFPKRKFVDFPKNYDQWLEPFLGNLKFEEYEKAVTKLKSRRGAVIKGMEDTTGGYKSFVAKNNRETWMEQFPGAFGAVFSQTFDVVKTSGQRDLEENAFTDQHRDKNRLFRDGGELLVTLPAGDGLAALVINAKGDRVEVVPANIAIHTRDPRDRSVRNGVMVCYNCHAEAYGWIPLLNTIEKDIPDEVNLNFKEFMDGRWIKGNARPDRQAVEDFDAFFIGWQDAIKPSRDILKANWLQASGTKARDYKDGLTGKQFGDLGLKWKHRYDDALNLKRMSRELGAPEIIVRLAGLNSTLKRVKDVIRKEEVARPAWDEDIFPELVKLLAAKRELVTPNK